MKKIATITFHSSYNYGSNLQAYALQEYVKKLCNQDCQYEIINLRTKKQKEMYENCFSKKGLKNFIKKILLLGHRKELYLKEQNFEHFISNYLNVTKEFSNMEEIKNSNLKYDYYISGSDQLWNISALDFDWSYFLEFTTTGKKISYSASFGPSKQTWSQEDKKRIKKDLSQYNAISVREQGSYDNVKLLTGKESEIHIDPTLLFPADEWIKIIPNNRKVNKDYIFLYDLGNTKETKKLAKIISKKFNMPVVVSMYMGKYFIFGNFEKYYDCGPLEFLNLIKNANLILSSSFHGTLFSILFHKPFFAINGETDFRISNILKKLNLMDRTINLENLEEKSKIAFDKINFEYADKILEQERKKSENYLKRVLDIK